MDKVRMSIVLEQNEFKQCFLFWW